jgi:hypothetical protein
MKDDVATLLEPIGLDDDEGTIHYGEAVLASMMVEPGDTFTKDEFIAASQSFYAGLTYLYPWLVAPVWDKGFASGKSRAMRHMSDEPDLPLAMSNPYLMES